MNHLVGVVNRRLIVVDYIVTVVLNCLLLISVLYAKRMRFGEVWAPWDYVGLLGNSMSLWCVFLGGYVLFYGFVLFRKKRAFRAQFYISAMITVFLFIHIMYVVWRRINFHPYNW